MTERSDKSGIARHPQWLVRRHAAGNQAVRIAQQQAAQVKELPVFGQEVSRPKEAAHARPSVARTAKEGRRSFPALPDPPHDQPAH